MPFVQETSNDVLIDADCCIQQRSVTRGTGRNFCARHHGIKSRPQLVRFSRPAATWPGLCTLVQVIRWRARLRDAVSVRICALHHGVKLGLLHFCCHVGRVCSSMRVARRSNSGQAGLQTFTGAGRDLRDRLQNRHWLLIHYVSGFSRKRVKYTSLFESRLATTHAGKVVAQSEDAVFRA